MCPNEELLEITNKAVTRFLWYPSRKPKIKSLILSNSKIYGGVSAPNIETKIRAFRIIFLVNIHIYSSLKTFDYFFDRYNILKSTKKRNHNATFPSFTENFCMLRIA